MTVGELIRELQTLPQGAQVVISKDAEGNGFSPLDAPELVLYVAESPWSGEVYDSGDTDAVADFGAQSAICLWPVN